MAVFHVIRYTRTFLNSDMFGHIEPGSDADRPLAVIGTYQGHRYPLAAFEDALLMSSKKADKLIRKLIGEGFPADIMEKVAIEIAEPA